jgi:hypothetical protein
VLAAGIALIVLAILISLIGAIWVGVPLVIVGIALIVWATIGVGRRASRAAPPA